MRGGWISLNLVDPLPAGRKNTTWIDTCQRRRMHAGNLQRGNAIFASAPQHASPVKMPVEEAAAVAAAAAAAEVAAAAAATALGCLSAV